MIENQFHRIRNSLAILGKKRVAITFAIIVLLAAASPFVYREARLWLGLKEVLLQDSIKLFDEGKRKESLKILERLHARYPEDKTITERLAIYYYQSGNLAKFMKITENAELDSGVVSNYFAAINRLGGDDQKTEDSYKKMIEDYPKSVNTYIVAASYYLARGNTNKALEIVEEGIKSVAQSSKLYAFASSVSLRNNDYEKARNYAEKALSIDKNNGQAEAVLSAIEGRS